MGFETEQETFWAGDFGREYIGRNTSAALAASNLAFFARALRVAGPIGSCLELGANVGMNCRALSALLPELHYEGVEINPEAAARLAELVGPARAHEGSLLEWRPTRRFDLAMTKGVLIHVNPDELDRAYDALHASSRRYVLIAEYYNPTPVAVDYRGASERLFKRDFCAEMMARHPDLELLDYGFAYRHDPKHPQDDTTWFLMGKRGADDARGPDAAQPSGRR